MQRRAFLRNAAVLAVLAPLCNPKHCPTPTPTPTPTLAAGTYGYGAYGAGAYGG
jgi:hypothetical protein